MAQMLTRSAVDARGRLLQMRFQTPLCRIAYLKKSGAAGVSRILCQPLLAAAVISLNPGLAARASRLRGMRLIPEDIHPTCAGLAARRAFPLFCLAPRRVCPAPSIALGPVGSYPAFSPWPLGLLRAVVCFL